MVIFVIETGNHGNPCHIPFNRLKTILIVGVFSKDGSIILGEALTVPEVDSTDHILITKQAFRMLVMVSVKIEVVSRHQDLQIHVTRSMKFDGNNTFKF